MQATNHSATPSGTAAIHQLQASLPLAVPSSAFSPARRRGAHGSAGSLARLSRCDSNTSIASLLFELEMEELASDAAAPVPRLPSELQHFADLAQGRARRSGQATLWMDALVARAQVLDADVPEQDARAEEQGCNGNGSALSGMASAPVPASGTSHRHGFQDISAVWGTSVADGGLSMPSALIPSLSAGDVLSTSVAAAGSAMVDIRRFAESLASLGHTVFVRSGLYTCPPESGIGTISHKFVVVSMNGPDAPGTAAANHSPTYYVVDPNYLSHFQLASKGPEAEHYRQLLSLLPRVFVGTADQLAAMVNLLCKEMEKVFAACGVPPPPWRSPRVMQGRWLVNRVVEDQHVPATPPSTPHPLGIMQQGSGRTFSGELRDRLPCMAS